MNDLKTLEEFCNYILHEYAETDMDDEVILGYLAALSSSERQSLSNGFIELSSMNIQKRSDALELLHCAWEFDDPEATFILLSELTEEIDSALSGISE